MFPTSSDFVGRQRELAQLNAALEAAISGQGRLVMLAREPGIGKTRIAQELAAQAEALGASALWGRCYEEEGTPPYWPWLQIIGRHVQLTNPTELASYMESGAAAIGEILPELRERLSDLAAPSLLGPEQARFRLFQSITTFLNNAARFRPLLLVLDDLHWADCPSLLLLEFVAREIQQSHLLVVGTYRDVEVSRRHPLSQSLGNLMREQGFLRVQMSGLSQTEVDQLIQRTDLDVPNLSIAIHNRTDGNPLFVSEILRMLKESSGGPLESARIPEGVKDTIGRRLNQLSEDCNQVLAVASVIGREFDFRLLSTLVGAVDDFSLLGLIEEALSARLLEEVTGKSERYQFSHALVQEVLSQELSISRRVRLHGRIAEALEQFYGERVEVHSAELADHFSEAEALLGSEKLVYYSRLAGERALVSYAYEDAVTHFQRGLMARDISLSGDEPAADEEAAELLFGLARALSATVESQHLKEAFTVLSRAFEYYNKAGNVAQAVAVAEFQIGNPTGRIPEVGQMIGRALTLVPDDCHEAGRLLSRYGFFLGLAEGDYEGARQALGKAMDIARREGDLPLEVQTLSYAADVSAQHLHWREGVDHGLRAIQLATGVENPYAEVLSRFWAGISLLHMGELESARRHALVLRDIADRRSTSLHQVGLSLVPMVTLACLEGDWKAGRECSDRVLEMSPLNPQILALRVLLEHETGEVDQGEFYLERLLESINSATPFGFASRRLAMVIAAVCRITGGPGHWELAKSDAEPILPPVAALYAKAGLSLLAVQERDKSGAKEHYAYLLGHQGTMIWTFASADRLLGLLSQIMDRPERATSHFEKALTFCRQAGYRPELAWTCHDYADALLLVDNPGEREKAVFLLEEARSISTELGMRSLLKQVAALSERAESYPPKAPWYPDGLTQREVEVLGLVALGKSNREIAEELTISLNTVIRHVSHIFTKTGVANRAGAATYAASNGLASR